MIRVVIASLLLFLTSTPKLVHATDSTRAFEDYTYQSDEYRRKYSEFIIAKNEYLKFKSLTSQSTALEKTKAMMESRAQFLRSYMLLLTEKITEIQSYTDLDKDPYRTLLKNEITFLDAHTQFISAIGSLSDATRITDELIGRYQIMQAAFRQTTLAIALGNIKYVSDAFDANFASATQVYKDHASDYSLQKQQTIERWILQIKNKRDLYGQKIASVQSGILQIKSGNDSEIERIYGELVQSIQEAKQYLSEATSFLSELISAIKFID